MSIVENLRQVAIAAKINKEKQKEDQAKAQLVEKEQKRRNSTSQMYNFIINKSRDAAQNGCLEYRLHKLEVSYWAIEMEADIDVVFEMLRRDGFKLLKHNITLGDPTYCTISWE